MLTSPAGAAQVERTRVAGYAWCERDGEILLCRISPGIMAAGRWTLPGGGLHFGEDPAIGVLRELREETGLDGSIDALVAVRSTIIEPGETNSGHRIHAIGLLYRVSVRTGELHHEIDESTDQAAWVPSADLDVLPTTPLVGWARTVVGRT